MANYRLSQKAKSDISNIYIYTYKNFGETQADRYVAGLEKVLEALSCQPALGRKINHIRKGYFRFEYMSHSIFFRKTRNILEIIRILHNGMDMKNHLH